MEESAPKRRRTSPRTSIQIGPDATSQAAESSQPRSKRPSFASPTKASLARHHPEILERRRSQSPVKAAESRDAHQRIESVGGREQASSLENEDAPPRPEQAAAPSSSQLARRAVGSMAAPAKRSPVKPNPRPLPPPAPEGDDEMNPFLGRALRRSPQGGASMSQQPEAEPEPELPPSVPDAISSTPPRGIHSSPSRWRERQKAEKRKLKPSSPLKQAPPRPPETSGPTKEDPRRRFEPTRTERPEEEGLSLLDSVRKTRPYDPLAKKKQKRDTLRDEIDRLKKDLEIAQRENERIRLMQKSGRVLAPSDPNRVMDVVKRQHASSDSKTNSTTSQQLVKAVLNPARLLPFGKAIPQVTKPIKSPEKVSDIKSHHPVLMTAEEELPYLQLFSPFATSSNIAMLPQEADGSLRQLHSITLRSREIDGVFTAKIDMIVNALDLTILDLKVTALEPTAKSELGPFIEKICNGDCNRSMQRNVGILSWAMGEWLRVSIERAIFWFHLGKQLASTEAILESTQKLRTRKSRRRKDGEGDSDDESAKEEADLTKAELIEFMGRQSLHVSIPNLDEEDENLSLRLDWKINFDWTGEAESKVGVATGIPGKWHQVDQRGALGKLPKLFQELIEGGEKPETAVKTIVALVTGDR